MNSILETILDGVIVFDRDWHIVSVNQRGAEILGQLPQALIGQSLWDIQPEAVETVLYSEFQRSIAEQSPVCIERFDSELDQWFEINAYPSGSGLIALYQNITERKQSELRVQETCTALRNQIEERTQHLADLNLELDSATSQRQQLEAALKATNEQLAQILESITDGFCALDSQWQYAYVNQSAEQLLRKNRSELLGRQIWEVLPEFIDSEFYQKCYEVRESGVAARVESFSAVLGCWFYSNIYPATEGITIYFQDITARKQLEAERNQLLRQEQVARQQAERAERRAAFLHEAGAVLSSSLDYNITLARVAQLTLPVLADFCLIHRLEANGQLQTVAAIHRNPSRQDDIEVLGAYCQTSVLNSPCLLAQVLRTGTPRLVSHWTKAAARAAVPDPSLRELYQQLGSRSVMVLPLKAQERIFGTLLLGVTDADRRYTEADFSLADDLAQRAAVAIDNAQLHQQLLEAHRLKDEFLMNLSHELRSPMNAILGWASILKNQRLDQRIFQQALDTIERKARAQVQIVYDLLTTAQIVTGKMQLNPVWVDLASIVEGAIASLRVALEAKSIQLEVSLNASVGPMRGDPKYLQQIVWNLLSNAIKFTPDGGRISIDLSRSGNRAQLQIRDTGYGIGLHFLPHVFERFRQADGSSRRAYSGLGLGLALVRHLVELHGGTVEADSPGEGQGATFTVLLPLPDDCSSAVQQLEAIPSDELADTRQVLNGLRLLVIILDPDEQAMLIAMLEGYGATATAVSSVEEAVNALNQSQPSLLITDIGVSNPDLLMQHVLLLQIARCQRIPVVALTASDREGLPAAAQRIGFQHFIPKPINPIELAFVISNATEAIE